MSDFITNLLEKLKSDGNIRSYGSEIHPDVAKYFVTDSKGVRSRFTINGDVLTEDLLNEDDKEKLKTLFFNNIWPYPDSTVEINDLVFFIDSNTPKNSAIEKQDRVLSFIRSQCHYDGYQITIPITDYAFSELWRKTYVKNIDEFVFYLDSLINDGYLSCAGRTDVTYHEVTLSILGLNKIVAFEEKNNSKTCFVAMSFDKDLRSIYNLGIVPALRETGFEPLRIDNDHTISSDVTINDAILAAIKKSKFTIADFTRHKNGVYFEAGYALGRGHKVIYACQEDSMGGAHFDTRNYLHIVWKNAEDLKQQLIDRIEVFIKA